MMKRIWLNWLLLGMLACAEEAETRKWTDTSGRSFDGSLVSATADAVEVKRADGKTFTISRAKLSKEDNAYLDQQKAKPAAPVAEAKMAAGEHIAPGWAPRLAGYSNPNPDFTSPWPNDTKVLDEPKIDIITESESDKSYVYESPHFRFESNCQLRPSLVAKFAMMFEACYEAHKAIPLNNRRTRATQAPKFIARIFETKEQYHKAGGPQGSAGVYMSGPDAFMVYLEALGVKKVGSGYMFDYSGDFHTVYHEVTHLVWADTMDLAGMWMTEGFAEYMASAPYSNGRFSFNRIDRALLEYATAYGKKSNGGRALGEEFSMPHLKEFMTWDQPKFYSGDANKHYGYGLLLTYFFANLDGDCKKFRECFKAAQQGKSEEEARQILLGGRSYEQLETEFAAAMRKKGIKVKFE